MKTNKKAQLTIFLIVGILLLFAIAFIFIVARIGITKVTPFPDQVNNVKSYVSACVDKVSNEGLSLAGNQAGRIYVSQGGTIIDYSESDKGTLYLFNEYYIPYGIRKIQPQTRYIGVNTLNPLRKKDGPQSIQEQLEKYISNNLEICTNFGTDVFKSTGLTISSSKPSTIVTIGEDDVQVHVAYPVQISKKGSSDSASLLDFYSNPKVRLGRIYTRANLVIESIITNQPALLSEFSYDSIIVGESDKIYNDDTIIWLTDRNSIIDNQQYSFVFAKQDLGTISIS